MARENPADKQTPYHKAVDRQAVRQADKQTPHHKVADRKVDKEVTGGGEVILRW